MNIKSCRYCKHPLRKKVVSLSNMPLTNEYIYKNQTDIKEFEEDINIFECSNCGLVQNPINLDYEGYYRDYDYTIGHSTFAQNFFDLYAEIAINFYTQENGFKPKSVLEIGSGDGCQLSKFIDKNVIDVTGVEGSKVLVDNANSNGIKTIHSLFNVDFINNNAKKYDICLSSYTFDHASDPREYLRLAHNALNENGILAIEIHNLDEIIKRTEYCLFEHEHTIYLTPNDAKRFLELNGFTVLSLDPIDQKSVRANSLIIIAKKVQDTSKIVSNEDMGLISHSNKNLDTLNFRINKTIENIESWIDNIPPEIPLVGFGAGGRGTMTLAALSNYSRFSAVLDSNYQSGIYALPKTRIDMIGPDEWSDYSDSMCLVLSYGYFDEIKATLINKGFLPERIHSLKDLYEY